MRRRLVLLAWVFIPWAGYAEEVAPSEVVGMVETLLEATAANDLEKFETVCDDTMKSAMTPQVLAGVHVQVASLMKGGYQKSYMGSLNRAGFTTYYWKISFREKGADDILAEMSVKDGKVGGFYLR